MKFEEFKASKKGQLVLEMLSDHDAQVEMVCLSKHGLPAAQAVGAEIGKLVGDLDDTVVDLDLGERRRHDPTLAAGPTAARDPWPVPAGRR